MAPKYTELVILMRYFSQIKLEFNKTKWDKVPDFFFFFLSKYHLFISLGILYTTCSEVLRS